MIQNKRTIIVIIIVIIAVISTARYFTDTAFYKINKNVYIIPQK